MRKILERHPRPPTPEATRTWCQAAWVTGFLLLLHGEHDSAREVISRSEKALADLTGLRELRAGSDAGDGRSAQLATKAELTAAFLQLRSQTALVTGDTETTTRYAQASLATGRWSDSLLTRAQCIAQLGFAAVLQGDHTRSTALLEEALALSEARGDTWHRLYLLWALAVDHGEAGRPKIALQLLRRALRHARQIDEHLGEATLSETLAWILSANGDPRSAAILLGAVDRVWHPSGVPRLFGFALLSAHRERGLRNARKSLGEIEYARAYQEGQHLGLRQALEKAFGDDERFDDDR